MDDGREDKNPWIKWFWQDWQREEGLRLASLAAKGLWVEMLCIMSGSTRKGFLLIGDKPVPSKDLADLTHTPESEIITLTKELRRRGVFSETDENIIFNRRMAREAALSEAKAKAGRLGGKARSKIQAKLKQDPSRPIKRKGSKIVAASVSASVSASASIFFEVGVWGGIRDDEISAWSEAYPTCNVLGELKKMAEWLKANPDKKKIRYRRFIVNWLSRTQDRGGSGSRRGNREPDPPHVGANPKPDKSPAYWAEVRRLKAEGIEGQALTDALAKKAKEGKV